MRLSVYRQSGTGMLFLCCIADGSQLHGCMRKLDGKIALVTGASKGIGAGIALSLAKEGAAVAVNYASDREGADRVVEKIKAAGGKAIAVQGNVTSSEEIDRFFKGG